MKKLFLLLIIPTLLFSQSYRGTGGGASVSSMLAIVADSSKWTSGTHVHAIKPRGGKSVQADTVKAGYLNVTGDTQLDGNLTMNTVASESLKVLAGGIRNEGGLIQKGNSSFGLQQTPKSTVQITGNGISSVNYYKGLRLSNPDAATAGVQALSPALVFRGAGWKTDATAGSDSVLWAITNQPAQGSSAPSSRLMFNYKIGAGSWTSAFYIYSNGEITAAGAVNASAGLAYMHSAGFFANYASGMNLKNLNASGSIIFSPGNAEYGRWLSDGNLGLGTDAPKAKLSVVGTAGTGTGIHVVSTTTNKKRDSWAQATDTSSVSLRLDSAGNPRLGMVAADGDSARLHVRADSTELYSKNALALNAPAVKFGNSNMAISKIDTVFTAGYVPRWVKFTSGGKSWYSPVYADTTGKW